MKQRLPLALSAAALAVALLSSGSLVAASTGVVRHALFADSARTAATANIAKRANVAKRAALARTATTARNALAVNGLKASALAVPGTLFPLGSDGRLPATVLPSASQPVVVRAVRSTPQTIPIQPVGPPVAQVAFTGVDIQVGGSFFDSATPTVLTVPADGTYLITAQVSWQIQNRGLSPNWGFNRAIYIQVNGDGVGWDQRPPAEETRQNADLIWLLHSGDKLSLGVAHDNPGGLDIQPYASLSAVRVA
jgi:hypothetical protein